jgi:hypothetical protein
VIYTGCVVVTAIVGGIINIAIVGPAALGGGLAAPLGSVGGYPTLFAATAAVAACGSIFVWRIKSVP